MSGGVSPEVAAQAAARREAAAQLGSWRDMLLTLSKEFPPGSGLKPVEETLKYLREAEDKAGVVNALKSLEAGVSHACNVNDTDALEWKSRGNDAYSCKKLEECILMYTRGMMSASEDDTLAALINNRSAAFMAQGRITEALADAHAAFTLTPSYWKALQRRGSCLQRLGFIEEGTKDMEAASREEASGANGEEVVKKILHAGRSDGCCDGSSGNVVCGNATVVSGSANISYGTGVSGVVAKGPLDPGDIIREVPVAYALYDDHWGVRCCFCLKATRLLYSGAAYRSRGKSARGLFCSEVCAATSWERDGQYETTNAFFHLCPVDALVACRMLRSEQILRGEELPLRSNFTGELYPAAVIGGYETAVSLLALVLGAADADGADRLRLAQRQVTLSAFELKFHTGTQININTETREALIDESRTIPVGKAVYVTAARFRHSCQPNCFASFVGNPLGCSLQLCIRAMRSVQAGEELTIAYHNMTKYKAVSAHTRRRSLVERCGFLCECIACRDDKDESVTSEKKAYYIQASDLYQKGCRLIREGQFETAVNVLSQSYALTMEHLCPPPRPPQTMVPKVHMALAKAFNRLRDDGKCVEHLVKKVELDNTLYGTDHVEMADDFIRLAFFESTEEKRRKSAERAVELLRRFYAQSRELDEQTRRIESFVTRSSPCQRAL
ncbi:TPR repeat/SET domain containing protein [Trypanosoma brucei equiperdum]|uniref:TPR repeat/SET domain containing protein n=1 Tax=Trypanosoma brucei equiperdum TaxID=630700 RepID=A0A3L6L9C7_9TRYP|nr:TPR repeat/SET domain containing protein [Trypanosoma brucei equiperdum]